MILRTLSLAAAIALVASVPARAQAHQHDHQHAAAADTTKKAAMQHDCPLQLTGITLTAEQETKVKAIRDAHHASMKAGMKAGAGDSAKAGGHDMHQMHEMHMAMQKAVADVRAVLTPAQQTQFDALVAKHEAAEGKGGMQCPMMKGMHGAQGGHAGHSGH